MRTLSFCLLAAISLLGYEGEEIIKAPDPFPFVGSLLAPIGNVIPYKEWDFNPYIYCFVYTANYGPHWQKIDTPHTFLSINPQFTLYYGIAPRVDISITPQFFYERTQHQQSVQWGDFPVALDFQILRPSATPYFPGIKLRIQETFPTGKYQKLNPRKLLTDSTGTGAFATVFQLVFYKVFGLPRSSWLSMNISGTYTISSAVTVHGFNAYGGGPGTKRKVYPGDIFQAIASFELSLSQHWAIAIDNVYLHMDRTTFKGAPDMTNPNIAGSIFIQSSEQISFAPAIEYAFNPDLGIAVGVWFTAWGRNSAAFTSGVFELSYTF